MACLDSEEIFHNFGIINTNLFIPLDIWIVIKSAIQLWFIHRNVQCETCLSYHQVDFPVLLFRIFREYAHSSCQTNLPTWRIPYWFLDLYICLLSMAMEENFSSGSSKIYNIQQKIMLTFFYLCRIYYKWPTAKKITEFIEEIFNTELSDTNPVTILYCFLFSTIHDISTKMHTSYYMLSRIK